MTFKIKNIWKHKSEEGVNILSYLHFLGFDKKTN